MVITRSVWLCIGLQPVKLAEDDNLLAAFAGGACVDDGQVPTTTVEFDFVSTPLQLQAAAAVQIQSRWR